ncbi:hypothetical protein HK102_012882, partial [Quaeritorhiza haematococci]
MTGPVMKVSTPNRAFRWYVITAPSLLEVRRNYMKITGFPLLPPKEYINYQQSIFGYRNWTHVRDELKVLRDNKFPVDGIILDLYWFGGGYLDPAIYPIEERRKTKMGTLAFNTTNFPSPSLNAKQISTEYGISFTLIEEPYIGERTQTFPFLARQKNALAQSCPSGRPDSSSCSPSVLVEWWGVGGYLDFTTETGRNVWHDCKRCAVIAGCTVPTYCPTHELEPTEPIEVAGHWMDLGEPENFDPDAFYGGLEPAEE